MYEVGDEGLSSDWVSQYGEDIQEDDTLVYRSEAICVGSNMRGYLPSGGNQGGPSGGS